MELWKMMPPLLMLLIVVESGESKYEPTWPSLDTRPLPGWYDEAKFGIFLHWGLYSVPSFGDEWFWQYWRSNQYKPYVEFMRNNYRPNFTYADFAPQFTAEFFRPDAWADLIEAAGARYVVLTTKHHEGYTLWPSKYAWNWNAVDTGPRRDLVGDLAAAIRKKSGLHFGVYHSLFEWFNPIWLQDQASNFTERNFPQAKTIPELYELVENYKPDVIWSDGSIMASGGSNYWGSKEFIAWLYNESPVRDRVVVNDRWGKDAGCKHGDFFTCRDRYNPGVLLPHKWENCMTVDRRSWGYRRDATLADILSVEELIQQLAETVSCGGNLLLNVGPTHDGRIVPIFEERLRQIGSWMKINGKAIYGSNPWTHQNDTVTTGVWYTQKTGHVYATVLSWPDNEELKLGSIQLDPKSTINMLGYEGKLRWTQPTGGPARIRFPNIAKVKSHWAWVLEMKLVKPKEIIKPKQGDPTLHEKFSEGPMHV